MSHLDVETLSAWLEGDLFADGHARAEAHLDRCERCRGEAQGLREMLDRVRAQPPGWAGKESAWEGVAARIDDRGSARERVGTLAGSHPGRGHRRVPGSRKRWVPAGALAAAAVVLLFVLLRPEPGSMTGPKPPPALAALLEADRTVARDLAAAARAGSWSSPEARRSVLSVNEEISRGVDALVRALEERPQDPALADLLRRAVQHRMDLVREVPL